MPKIAQGGCELDDAGRKLLALLVALLPAVKPGDKKTYVSYKLVHDQLGLPSLGISCEESLRRQGLTALTTWTHDAGVPAITGVIIDTSAMVPEEGYFRLSGRPANDFAWWMSEIEKSKAFDWSGYLLPNLEIEPRTFSSPTLAIVVEEANGAAWTVGELRSAVEAYLDMMAHDRAGKPYVKKQYYEKLAGKFNRTAKAFEYRMQNISYVLSLMGRDWLRGLKPAKNVGAQVAGQIEQLLAEAEGRQGVPIVAFEIAVRDEVKKKQLPVPTGSDSPQPFTSASTQYARDPEIKAWILQQADGVCECCKKSAPFKAADGMPYLEVHHVRRLADQGSDQVSNAVAVCPNCHRELHYGAYSKQLVEQLYLSVERLVCE